MVEHLKVVTWRVPRANADALEHVTLKAEEREAFIRALAEVVGTREVVYFPTCQRVLFAFATERALPDIEKPVYGLFAERDPRLPPPEWFDGFRAFEHLAEVASSLDSLVPGEAQVLGQMKDAVTAAMEQGRVGKGLEHVFQLVFRTAKRVRSRTDLFRGKVSLIPLTLEHVQAALGEKPEPVAVVIGTGTIGQKMIELLRERDDLALHVVSKSAERAETFAASHDAQGWSLTEFLRAPPKADLVALATPAEAPYFLPEHARACARGGRVTVIDLSLPRNAADAVKEVPGVTLVQLDELVAISERSRAQRSQEMDRARALLKQELQSVEARYAGRHLADNIVALRNDLLDAADERWDRGAQAFPAAFADPEFRKWYEQTTRHLVHVAQKHFKAERAAQAGSGEGEPRAE